MRGVVIVARPRTGTNWLSELITAMTDANNLREVLDPQSERHGNFFRWLETRLPGLPFHRSLEWTRAQIISYLDEVEASFPVPLVDIKYTSFSAFEPTWRPPLSLPQFLQELMARRYRIIHLVRESTIDTAVSDIVANATGIWVAGQDYSGPPKMEVDVKQVMTRATAYRDEIKHVESLLRDYPNRISITYETIQEAERTERLEEFIRDVVSGSDLVPSKMKTVSTKKLIPNWRSVIINSEEIEREAIGAGLQ